MRNIIHALYGAACHNVWYHWRRFIFSHDTSIYPNHTRNTGGYFGENKTCRADGRIWVDFKYTKKQLHLIPWWCGLYLLALQCETNKYCLYIWNDAFIRDFCFFFPDNIKTTSRLNSHIHVYYFHIWIFEEQSEKGVMVHRTNALHMLIYIYMRIRFFFGNSTSAIEIAWPLFRTITRAVGWLVIFIVRNRLLVCSALASLPCKRAHGANMHIHIIYIIYIYHKPLSLFGIHS